MVYIDKLLDELKRLYALEDDYVDTTDGRHSFRDSDIYRKTVGMCNQYLITDTGGCNWNNIDALRRHGYRVFAGERDGFGWLTGCVQKKDDKRIVYYG